MNDSRDILIIAGEISGDMHAAGVVRSLRAIRPGLRFFGVGGPCMESAGVELHYHVRDTAVMGFVEVLKHIFFFRRMFHSLLQSAKERRPAAVILVDYPGFNLRFAAQAHKLGLKVIYYICPQVWAWNRSRIGNMAKTLDRLITIFPFEVEVFRNTGLPVDFAGHPLVSETTRALAEPEADLPWNGSPRIALLPGSRKNEIERILPVMCRTADLLEQQYPGAAFLVAAPDEAIARKQNLMLAKMTRKPRNIRIIPGQTREILRQATIALVASGTATIETALMRCPMAVIYRVSPITYLLAKMLVRVPYIGMVNIIAGREVCREFIQHKACPAAIVTAVLPLLTDTKERRDMLASFEMIRKTLGTGDVANNAARLINETISVDH
jgi:lipid-A-disaccharide synthase